MVLQILGKVRVALSPKEPEWAHVALYVSARGITTGPVPSTAGLFEVEADLLDHEVAIRVASGDAARVALRDRPVAEFWREFVDALRSVGIDTELPPMPQEVPDPIPFPDDTTHHVYDGEAANRFWRVLTLIEPVFEAYRAAFQGKVSRVQFFWGSADLAVTRFSGEPCTPPAGAGLLDRGAYDYEQMSVGWWPGNASFPEPAFYAYAYPKPDGIESAELASPGASWNARPRRVHPPLRRRARRAVARGHGPPIPRRRLRRLRFPLRLGPQPHQVRTGVVRSGIGVSRPRPSP